MSLIFDLNVYYLINLLILFPALQEDVVVFKYNSTSVIKITRVLKYIINISLIQK